ncbi:hypothetical protein, partial [Klebsiella pneumoniae]|uniref:hypothetical protein n=1 Tax=Klebsiella pneumoniae TaxID=573 RepID=UPI001D0E1B41
TKIWIITINISNFFKNQIYLHFCTPLNPINFPSPPQLAARPSGNVRKKGTKKKRKKGTDLFSLL